MTYAQWFDTHGKKHRAIVEKLLQRGLNDDEIIDYFAFENMVENEPGFCPLYETPKRCHDIKDLNCYLCACPHFRFSDEGLHEKGDCRVKSECAIGNGSALRHEDVIHQDCSKCTIPHRKEYIQKHFSTDWFKIMGQCPAPL